MSEISGSGSLFLPFRRLLEAFAFLMQSPVATRSTPLKSPTFTSLHAVTPPYLFIFNAIVNVLKRPTIYSNRI